MIKVPNPFEIADSHTEWSVAAFVMENLVNGIIKEKHYALGPARVEKIGIDRKRPDGVIYIDPLGTRTLINIEFKQPFFDPFDFENLKEPARKKAVSRKAQYFGTCNFRELIIFNTERVNKNLPEEQQIVGKYHLSEIYDLDLIEESNIQSGIKKSLEKFLEDLIGDFTGKKPLPLLPLDEFLIYRLHEKIKILSFYYKELIKRESQNPPFTKELALWFVDQNWSFTYQEQDYEKAARQAAYLLVNKILFYDVLRAKKPNLSKLEIPESLAQGQILQKTLQAYFDEVLKIDYQTIYSTDFIDKVAFPENKEVVYQIKELIKILERFDFSSLGFEVIGRIFERLIPFDERHTLGQYFTNPDVVDIILKFALRHEDDKVFDPGCGAGTFLVRAYQHKKLMNQRLPHEEILKTLWGNDIAKFPAHLTTINLAINDLSSNENYPRVVQKDFFEWLGNHKEIIELPESSRKVFLKTLSDEEKQQIVPRYFDCLVGNPPYTRQEEIADISGEDKDYKENLIASAVKDVDGRTIADISKRAGLHAYFFVHGTKFLQNGGRFGFIVSNSWLDVDYGKGLQEFFLNNYKIIAVVESKVERWFEEADVNTCIVLLEKASGESNKKERDKNLVKFVYLKKPLREFIPAATDLWQAQVERLDAIDNLLKTIYAHSELYENDDLRIFPKSQNELWEEGFDEETQQYEGAKWGKYLRAPDIYFKFLKKNKDKLLPLGKIGEILPGCYSGINDFFYLSKNRAKDLKIESRFLQPILRSTREVYKIRNKINNLENLVFDCNISKEGLIRDRANGALSYIRWGEKRVTRERQKVSAGIPWPKVETVKTRKPGWWSIPRKDFRKTKLFLQYVINDKVSAPLFDEPLTSDRCYHRIFTDESSLIPLFIILNSTIINLQIEVIGRTALGQGALKFETSDAKQILVYNPLNLSKQEVDETNELAQDLEGARILPLFETFGSNDPSNIELDKIDPYRRKVDQFIAKIFDFAEDEEVELYRSVLDLIKSRLERAKSVKNKKTTKSGFNLELMAKTILDKADTQSLGDFYKRHILSKKPLKKIQLPKLDKSVRLEKTLLDYRLSSGRESIDCSSEEEGRYLKVFLEVDWEEVLVPENDESLKQVLPRLENIASKVKEAIDYYTDSILDSRLKDQIVHLVWQKVSEIPP